MTAAPSLSASLEDYLEAIYNIIREKNAVRAKDIAARLKVSNASVTGALRTLAKRNFLNYAPYDVITLTPEGERIAKEVVRRHEILRDFFVKVLAVEQQKADEAACKLEHGFPSDSDIIDRLVQFIEFIEICPLGGPKLIEGFKRHLNREIGKDKCIKCIELARDKMTSDISSTKQTKKSTLAGLGAGEKGVVKRIRAKGLLRKRLIEQGLTPGSLVEVERVAPMGDPVEVKVKGYHLSLRKDEVSKIEIQTR